MIYNLYKGEIELNFTESNHRYKVNGEYKQGVTTLLNSVTSKDGLISWAARLASNTYYSDLGRLLTKNGVITHQDLASCLEVAKRAHTAKKDKGGDIGTSAHGLIEEFVRAKINKTPEPELRDDNPQTNNCLTAFKEWDSKYQPKYIKSEQPLYSKMLDYCGTADCIAEIDGKLTMIDFKTANPDVNYRTGIANPYPKDFLQCAAYDQAHYEEHSTKCDQYMLVYITKTKDLYVFVNEDTETSLEAWKCAVKLSRCYLDLKKIKKSI